MNEMENLGDGLRSEMDRAYKVLSDLDNKVANLSKCLYESEKSIKDGDVVKMHEMYEKLKQWE